MDGRKGSVEDLEVSPAFWQGKKVFITGHTGFKGSWLSLWLVRLGADVTGYALPAATHPSLYRDAAVARDVRSIEADVRDFEQVRAALSAQRPEVVVHMAAEALVPESYLRPLETYATNVLGTANVLEVLRTNSTVRATVIVTSDKCYRLDAGDRRCREDDALGGHDPYSASKACAEIVSAAYRESFFTASRADATSTLIATARAGNVIGGGDWAAHRLIPDAVAAFRDQRVLALRNPAAIRPWQHVLDPLRGYLLLAQRLFDADARCARAWNFGPPPSHEVSVESLVRDFAQAWGSGARWEAAAVPGPFEAPALRLSSRRANETLGWNVRLPLARALEETAQWYRAYVSGADARALVDAHIDRFEGARTA